MDDFAFSSALLAVLILHGINLALGEWTAKQYFRKSTTWLDRLIFSLFPSGICITLISVIRARGNSLLRSSAGEPNDKKSSIQIDVRPSTSRKVCEVFDESTITRINGKPLVLSLIHAPSRNPRPSDGKDLLLLDEYFTHLPNDDGHQPEWKRVQKSKKADRRAPIQFPPNPNLTINVGSKQRPPWIHKSIAVAGLVLNTGFFIMAWFLENDGNAAEKEAQDGSGPSRKLGASLYIAGTIAHSSGIFRCTTLIHQMSCEERFERNIDASTGSQLIWVQPGNQDVGGSPLDPYVYIEKPDRKLSTYYISCETDCKDKPCHSITGIALALFGFFALAAGLWCSSPWFRIATGVTMFGMIVSRIVLHLNNLAETDNELCGLPDTNHRHELDYLAFQLLRHCPVHAMPVSRFAKGHDGKDCLAQQWSISWDKRSGTGMNCTCVEEVLNYRIRLAHLTGHIPSSIPVDFRHQNWTDEHVALRTISKRLAAALCLIADKLHDGKQARDIAIEFPVAMNHGGESRSGKVTITIKAPSRACVNWSVDATKLEGILGLCVWSLRNRNISSEEGQTDPQNPKLTFRRVLAADIDQSPGLGFKSFADLWMNCDPDTIITEAVTTHHPPRSAGNNPWLDERCKSVGDVKEQVTLLSGRAALLNADRVDFGPEVRIRQQQQPPDDKTATAHARSREAKITYTTVMSDALSECTHEMFTIALAQMVKSHPMELVRQVTAKLHNGKVRLKSLGVTAIGEILVQQNLAEPDSVPLWILPTVRHILEPEVVPALLKSAQAAQRPEAETLFKLAFTEAIRRQTKVKTTLVAIGEFYRSQLRPSPSREAVGHSHQFARGIAWMLREFRSNLTQTCRKGRESDLKVLAHYVALAANVCGIEYFRAQGKMDEESMDILQLNALLADATDQSATTVLSRPNIGSPNHVMSPPPNQTSNDQLRAPQESFLASVDQKSRMRTLIHLSNLSSNNFNKVSMTQTLPIAASYGWDEAVAALLALGVPIDTQDSNGRTALMYFSAAGDEEQVHNLLGEGADALIEDCFGQHALHCAVRSGNVDTVRRLLQTKDIDVNGGPQATATPLAIAMERDFDAIAKLLIQHGQYAITGIIPFRKSPIWQAVECRRENIVKILLTRPRFLGDVQPDYPPSEHNGPLGMGDYVELVGLALSTESIGIVRLLLDYAKNVHTSTTQQLNWNEQNLILYAIQRRRSDVLEAILKHITFDFAHLHADERSNPLIAAVQLDNDAAIKLLLAHGVNITIEQQLVALYHAVCSSRTDIAKRFASHVLKSSGPEQRARFYAFGVRFLSEERAMMDSRQNGLAHEAPIDNATHKTSLEAFLTRAVALMVIITEVVPTHQIVVGEAEKKELEGKIVGIMDGFDWSMPNAELAEYTSIARVLSDKRQMQESLQR